MKAYSFVLIILSSIIWGVESLSFNFKNSSSPAEISTQEDAFFYSQGSTVSLGPEYTTVTVTSCSNNICSMTASKAMISLATTTSAGVETVYTTYCPLTSTSSTTTANTETKTNPARFKKLIFESSTSVPAPEITYITTLSCSLDICHTKTTPVSASYITSTSEGVITVYTTYCPLTESQPTTSLTVIQTCESCHTFTSSTPTSYTTSTTETHVVSISSSASSISLTKSEITTYITITSCSENKCHITTSPTILPSITSSDTETIDTTPTCMTCKTEKSSSLVSYTTSSLKTLTTFSLLPESLSSSVSIRKSVSESASLTSESYYSETQSVVYTKSSKSSIQTSVPTKPSEISTTITITSCSNNVCTKTTSKALVTLVTTTSAGIETIYTTYCPLSTSTTEETSTSTTHSTNETTEIQETTTSITVTSCSSDVCGVITTPALVQHITTTIGGIETIYTTYCPLSSTTESTQQADSPITTSTTESEQIIETEPLVTTPTTDTTTLIMEALQPTSVQQGTTGTESAYNMYSSFYSETKKEVIISASSGTNDIDVTSTLYITTTESHAALETISSVEIEKPSSKQDDTLIQTTIISSNLDLQSLAIQSSTLSSSFQTSSTGPSALPLSGEGNMNIPVGYTFFTSLVVLLINLF